MNKLSNVLFISALTLSTSAYSMDIEDTDSGETWFNPILNISQLYLKNPSLGQNTGQSESVTIIAYGANIDLENLAGINDTKIHFEQIYVPFIRNETYGMAVADSIFSDPAPYIPKSSHLQKFTIESTFLDDKLTLEVGKSGATHYFAKSLCNLLFGCQSPLIPFRPGVYASWGARGQYKLTNEISVQTGVWNYIDAYPLNNGWEWNEGESDLSMFGNITYGKDGKYFEALLWGTNETQVDPLTSEETDDESGIYLGYKTPLYEGGQSSGFFKVPSVSFVEQFTYGFNDQNSKGLAYTNAIGLNIGSPFTARPYDQYGVMLKTYKLTDHMQQALEEGYAQNSINYDKDNVQKAVQIDANFMITPYLIASAFGQYSWDVNSKNNSYNRAELPEDGFGFGLMGILLLDKLM